VYPYARNLIFSFKEICMKREEWLERLLDEVSKNGLRLKVINNDFKTLPICSAAVRQNGLSLAAVPDALKTEQICITAVTQNWLALRLVPPEKRTLDVCIAALRKSKTETCFSLIPSQIKWKVKRGAGCYDFHAPDSRVISSIYNKA
jgi:hypothetical protein